MTAFRKRARFTSLPPAAAAALIRSAEQLTNDYHVKLVSSLLSFCWDTGARRSDLQNIGHADVKTTGNS
jgi:hypothetical protein